MNIPLPLNEFSWWHYGAVAAVVLFVGLAVLVLRLRRRGRRRTSPPPAPAEPLVRVDTLPADGPPIRGPQLLVYHLPVRLAALVLAPAGRDGELPSAEQLGQVVDGLIPGLRQVVDAHQPAFARWPTQLSQQGFVRTFFREVALPGERGRGTPWCSLAGRFEHDRQTYLVGLVCRAAADNSLGEVEIPVATKWLDVLQVRLPEQAVNDSAAR